MKKWIFIIISIVFSIALCSCEKDGEKDGDKNDDFYYIEYKITSNIYFYIDGVTYNTENGSHYERCAAKSTFDQICGPVNKGFLASINLTKFRGAPAANAVNIYVSKNNGPFAIKASGQYSATYTIDF